MGQREQRGKEVGRQRLQRTSRHTSTAHSYGTHSQRPPTAHTRSVRCGTGEAVSAPPLGTTSPGPAAASAAATPGPLSRTDRAAIRNRRGRYSGTDRAVVTSTHRHSRGPALADRPSQMPECSGCKVPGPQCRGGFCDPSWLAKAFGWTRSSNKVWMCLHCTRIYRQADSPE